MLGNGEPGRDVEAYTYAVHSEYYVVHRPVLVDEGQGPLVPVVFSFIVNALDVVVARKNNDMAAYAWVETHRVR